MFLRPFFAKLVSPGAFFFSLCLGGAAYLGCSGPESTSQCGTNGTNCVPVDGGQGGSSSSSSGDTSSSSSSSSNSSGSGGKPPCDPNAATCGCSTTGDCSGGLLCIDGLCIVGCDNTFECGAGKVCVNGKCEAGCNDQQPCGTGEKCTNGYCVPDSANPQCSMGMPCQSGQTCIDGVCEMSCSKNTDCLQGEVCDYTHGGCIPNPSPIPSCGPGKPCPGTAQCGPQGYCQFQCTDVASCKLIDSRFTVCDQNICRTTEETNPQCNLQKPCPIGQDCVSNKCL